MPSRTSPSVKRRVKKRVSPSKNYSSRHRFYQRCLLLEQACQSCHQRMTHLSATQQQLHQLREETEMECEEAWREREKLSTELRSLQSSNDLIQKETTARGPQLLKRMHSELEQVGTKVAEARSHEKAQRIRVKELLKQVKQAEDQLQQNTAYVDQLNLSLLQLKSSVSDILEQPSKSERVEDKSRLYSLDETTSEQEVGPGEVDLKNESEFTLLTTSKEQVVTPAKAPVSTEEAHKLVDMNQLALYSTYSDLSSLDAKRDREQRKDGSEREEVTLSDETEDEEVLEEMTEKFSLSPYEHSKEGAGTNNVTESPLKLDLNTSLKAGCDTQKKVHFQAEAVFLDAALEGELDVVRTCLRHGRVDVESKSGRGLTALHKAALRGSAQVVSLLLEKGADVNCQDPDGWTPLHCAVSVSNPEMVRHLVLNGSSLFTPNDDSDTPLKLAYDECEALHEAGGTFYDKYSSASATECLHFLLKVQNEVGIINGGKVYALYEYTAEHEDELTFSKNEQLRVLKRSSQSDSIWWQAMNSLGKKGLVPGNYFTCYKYTPTAK